MLTCFNQSPEQTSLVRSLKIQNRELTQTRNELEAELIKLRKSARMTRINELESQNLISQDEINHQKAISEVRQECNTGFESVTLSSSF